MKISFSIARRVPGTTLHKMQSTGVRPVTVRCTACNHEAVLDTDAHADAGNVQSLTDMARCTACGSSMVEVQSNWAETRHRRLYGRE